MILAVAVWYLGGSPNRRIKKSNGWGIVLFWRLFFYVHLKNQSDSRYNRQYSSRYNKLRNIGNISAYARTKNYHHQSQNKQQCPYCFHIHMYIPFRFVYFYCIITFCRCQLQFFSENSKKLLTKWVYCCKLILRLHV